MNVLSVQGTRSSKRLQSKDVNDGDSHNGMDSIYGTPTKTTIESNEDTDTGINYNDMPISSDSLDDFEFQVYTALRVR